MNKKRILAIILGIVIAVGAVAGVSAAVRKTTSGNSKVMVIPANELNYGYGSWDSESLEGYVTSDRVQNVNVSDTQTIKEIKVEEDDEVKKGDVLLIYDMTQTEVNLEKEKLSKERIEMSIDAAEKALARLKKMTPVSSKDGDDDDIDDIDDEDEDDDDDENTKKQKEPKAYKKLTSKSKPYYDTSEDADEPGSEDNPYRYLCKPGTTITSDFINEVKKLKNSAGDCYFVLEIRDPEKRTGKLIRAWKQNVNELQVDRDWVGILDPDSDKPVIPTKTYKDIAALEEKIKGLEEQVKKLQETGSKDSNEIESLKGEIEELKEKLAALTTAEEPAAEPSETPSEPSAEPTTDPGQTDEPTQTQTPTPSAEGGDSTEEAQEGENAQESEKAHAEPESAAEAEADTASARNITLPGIKTIPKADLAVLRNAAPVAVLTADTEEEDSSGEDDDDSYDSTSDVETIDTEDISDDAEYTREELDEAIKSQEESLKDLKLDLRESELKISSAEKAVADGSVKAAMDGVVTTVNDPETAALEGTPVIQVSSTSGVAIKGGLRENLLEKIHEGDEITIASWSNGINYMATITEISPYPDTSGMFDGGMSFNNSYYPFTAIVDDEDAELEDHDWVQISIDANTLAQDDDAFYLMKAFILEEGNTAYVYIRGEDGLLKRQNIQIGKMSGDSYEIRSGVGEEDWIAFPYGKNIKEGAQTYEGTFEDLYNM